MRRPHEGETSPFASLFSHLNLTSLCAVISVYFAESRVQPLHLLLSHSKTASHMHRSRCSLWRCPLCNALLIITAEPSCTKERSADVFVGARGMHVRHGRACILSSDAFPRGKSSGACAGARDWPVCGTAPVCVCVCVFVCELMCWRRFPWRTERRSWPCSKKKKKKKQ